MASSSASLGDYGFSLQNSSSQAAAPLGADMFTLKCETGFLVAGLQPWEAVWTPTIVLCTLVTMSVASAWISRRKSIKKLLIFFSHWLRRMSVIGIPHLNKNHTSKEYRLHYPSGALTKTWSSLSASGRDTGDHDIDRWAGSNLEHVIKAIKFLELASRYMLAITNLAICVNLALIVMAHRTLSLVKSLSSPPVIFLSVVLSIGIAASSAAFWETIILTATYFFTINGDQRTNEWMFIAGFFLEFFVGICMFTIVVWLLLFRMTEVKECWAIHARIRYYFGLTLIGIIVNLAVGVCGTIYIVGSPQHLYLFVISWIARHIHIALDTIVLYGVLGAPARQMDERGGSSSSDPIVRGTGSRGSSNSGSSSNGLRSFNGLTMRSSRNPRAPSIGQGQARPKESFNASRTSSD